jgi:hypothetical protein
MTTALDLITDALQRLSVYDPGQPVSAADAATGLTVLNDMMDLWSNETLSCFATLEQSGNLVPGQTAYTIGPGGNFNTTRPLRILTGPGSAYVQDANGNNYGMDVVERAAWNGYGNRSPQITSDFPDTMFYDPQFPLGIINVLPAPILPYTMFWDSYLQLSEFPTLATSVSLPPGYNMAIKTNLALYLKPYFIDGQVDPLLISAASESKGTIKRMNMRPNVAVFEPEIVSRAAVQYNPYTDRSGSGAS